MESYRFIVLDMSLLNDWGDPMKRDHAKVVYGKCIRAGKLSIARRIAHKYGLEVVKNFPIKNFRERN